MLRSIEIALDHTPPPTDARARVSHFVTDGAEAVGIGRDDRGPVRRNSLTD